MDADPCRRDPRYEAFTLVLQVNHACNLRCDYCYTGAKLNRPMPERVAHAAIDRACASLQPGGRLELGFFGGEPLLEPHRLAESIAYAERRTQMEGLELTCGLTTNGTLVGPDAWPILMHPRLELAISHDGLPRVHDLHRRGIEGGGTSATVEATLRRLVAAGRDFNAVLVIRPRTMDALPDGLRFLRSLGVRRLEPSLDLWTAWSQEDLRALRSVIRICADLWKEGLPEGSLAPFDELLLRFSGVPLEAGRRCGFGDGQIAVAPSGRLYPCERIIGEDTGTHPLRLLEHVLEGRDFLSTAPGPACLDGSCPCSNYVRTGSPAAGDALLLDYHRMCREEMLRAIGRPEIEERRMDGDPA